VDLLGFGSAKLLHAMSFADILNEDCGRGCQRRFKAQHSPDFRRHIQHDASGTIPLTFNLRPRSDDAWLPLNRRPPDFKQSSMML
jgi:hypothetical protein